MSRSIRHRALAASLAAAAVLPLHPLAAQLPAVPERIRAALAPLAYLEGEWTGTGWILTPAGKRETFDVRESVRRGANNTAYLFEGYGWRMHEGKELPVHSALAILGVDPRTLEWNMMTAGGSGGVSPAEVRVANDSLVWGFRAGPTVRVRFTITRTAAGEWHEVGHVAPEEGAAWRPFFEMRLTRRPDAPGAAGAAGAAMR